MERVALKQYGLAAVAVGMAALAESLIRPLTGPVLSPLFFAAVVLTASFAGIGPGLLATALAASASAFFFMPPALSFDIGFNDALRLAIFSIVAAVVGSLAAARRGAEAALRKARADAEAANHAKDQFIAVLSHELRTPLAPVMLTVSSMAADDQLPAAVREDASSIRRNIELQTRLIDDLLDSSRINNRKLILRTALFNPRELLRDCIADLGPEAEQKQVCLGFQVESIRCEIFADRGRLQQVFCNLIRNAIKFTPDGGRVTVSMSDAPEGRLRVTVSDTGVGIEPGLLPSVFNVFEQCGTSVTRRFGGLGLGLSIAKGIVDAHGGTITMSSDGRDRGATATVDLPATLGQEEAIHTEADRPAAGTLTPATVGAE